MRTPSGFVFPVFCLVSSLILSVFINRNSPSQTLSLTSYTLFYLFLRFLFFVSLTSHYFLNFVQGIKQKCHSGTEVVLKFNHWSVYINLYDSQVGCKFLLESNDSSRPEATTTLMPDFEKFSVSLLVHGNGRSKSKTPLSESLWYYLQNQGQKILRNTTMRFASSCHSLIL